MYLTWPDRFADSGSTFADDGRGADSDCEEQGRLRFRDGIRRRLMATGGRRSMAIDQVANRFAEPVVRGMSRKSRREKLLDRAAEGILVRVRSTRDLDRTALAAKDAGQTEMIRKRDRWAIRLASVLRRGASRPEKDHRRRCNGEKTKRSYGFQIVHFVHFVHFDDRDHSLNFIWADQVDSLEPPAEFMY